MKIKKTKKLCLRVLLLCAVIFSGILSSCGASSILSSGNVSNYGYVLTDKTDVYYTKTITSGNGTVSSNIYKYNTKTQTEILIAQTSAEEIFEMNAFMTLYNGELFFLTNYAHGTSKEWSPNIYKIKTDGKNTKPEAILEKDTKCSFMQIVNGMIYYYDYLEDSMYRVNPNGTKRELICELPMTAIAIGGGKIYFADYDILAEVSVNGGEPKEIYNFEEDDIYIESLILDGNYLYYTEYNQELIGRIRIDGKDNREVYKVPESSSAYIENFNIGAGKVYFTLDEYGESGDYAVLEITPGGNQPRVIVSDKNELGDISPLSIWGDTIYFVGFPIFDTVLNSDFVWFTVSKNGGNIEPFQPFNVY